MNEQTPSILTLTAEILPTASMLPIRRGLFVQFLVNTSDQAVHDQGAGLDAGGRLVIKPRGRTIRIGRFIDGLVMNGAPDGVAMLKRAVPGMFVPDSAELQFAPELGAYPECRRLLVVLDLSAQSVEAVDDAYAALTKALETFLRKEGLLVLDRKDGYCRFEEEDVGDELLPKLEAWPQAAFAGLGGAS